MQCIFNSYSNFLASSFCNIPQLIEVICSPQFSVLPTYQINLNGREIIFKQHHLPLTRPLTSDILPDCIFQH